MIPAAAAMRLPAGILVAALVLVATMAGGAWVDLRIDQTHARHVEISTGLEKMVRLNQDLSDMLMVSVLERNTLRSASYDSVLADLDTTVRGVERLLRQQQLSEDLSGLAEHRVKLRLIEQDALRLMRADDWPRARALLFDDAYVMARKLYEIDSETAFGTINGELAASNQRYAQVRVGSLAARAAALVLLLGAGFSFSRRLGRELAEQARLRGEVTAANQQLEDKVRERTAELEAANRQLASLSATDGLTGLPNRRRFNEAWESEWQRAMRQALPLAIAMVDVDEFKAYNDHYGHQAGDECLKRVAGVLGAVAQRAGEFAARYGGEEFAVVLPGLDADEAAAMGERIRAAVQALGLAHAHARPPGVVTISVGVASRRPLPGERSAALLAAADNALYQAKHAGRNRVVLAGANPPPPITDAAAAGSPR